MEVKITKTFTKQYLLYPAHVKEAVQIIITDLQKADSLKDIREIKKLSGFENFCRIRVGQYRIGLEEQKPKVLLLSVMERSQIYKVFPPQ